jgi:magnesium transporter
MEMEQEANQDEIRKEKIRQLIEAIERADKESVSEIFDSMHTIDLTEDMEEWEDELLGQFCSLVEHEKLALLFEESTEELRVHLAGFLDNSRILLIFGFMQKDDIVDILGSMQINRRKQLVDLMKAGERKIITELLGYEEDTAGGLMCTDYIALNGHRSIAESLRKIKQIGPRTEIIETIYVLNNRSQLVGKADLRDILIAQDEDTLNSISSSHVISVAPETDQEEVSLLVSKYDLNAIPVVNKRGIMLGIITVDDIIDVIMEEHTEDMLQMAGVNKEENINSTLLQSVKMRLPWLCVNLLTAFCASMAVRSFAGIIAQVVALSSTMTIVTGMGGNSGNQSLSIMIRSIALGEVELKGSIKLILKEILVGLTDGFFMGIGTGAIVYLIYGNYYLSLIIFIAMMGNLMISGLFGTLIPLVLKRLKLDPALASSIFLTAATDVLGFFIFLGLATLFLPFLL